MTLSRGELREHQVFFESLNTKNATTIIPKNKWDHDYSDPVQDIKKALDVIFNSTKKKFGYLHFGIYAWNFFKGNISLRSFSGRRKQGLIINRVPMINPKFSGEFYIGNYHLEILLHKIPDAKGFIPEILDNRNCMVTIDNNPKFAIIYALDSGLIDVKHNFI